MGLQIDVNLNSETYFPGDTIYCRINFQKFDTQAEESGTYSNEKNPSNLETDNNSPSAELKPESIVNLQIQIAGFYYVEQTYIKLPQSTPRSNNAASHLLDPKLIGENGKCIFSTQPLRIGEDKIYINGSKAYLFYVTLPYNLPPTMKETGIKCRYFVILSFLRKRERKVFTYTFRIFNPTSALKLTKVNIDQHEFRTMWKELEDADESLVDPKYQPKQSVHDSIMESDSLQSIKALRLLLSEQSRQVTMNITKGNEHLVKFTINKTAFRLGEMVKGTLDFSSSQILCFQISIRLQAEQIIDPSVINPSRIKKPIFKTVAEHHEITRNVVNTHFCFSLPIEATQELITELVTIKWLLSFEFITAKSPKEIRESEPLLWNLPIHVVAIEPPLEQIYKAKNTVTL